MAADFHAARLIAVSAMVPNRTTDPIQPRPLRSVLIRVRPPGRFGNSRPGLPPLGTSENQASMRGGPPTPKVHRPAIGVRPRKASTARHSVGLVRDSVRNARAPGHLELG